MAQYYNQPSSGTYGNPSLSTFYSSLSGNPQARNIGVDSDSNVGSIPVPGTRQNVNLWGGNRAVDYTLSQPGGGISPWVSGQSQPPLAPNSYLPFYGQQAQVSTIPTRQQLINDAMKNNPNPRISSTQRKIWQSAVRDNSNPLAQYVQNVGQQQFGGQQYPESQQQQFGGQPVAPEEQSPTQMESSPYKRPHSAIEETAPEEEFDITSGSNLTGYSAATPGATTRYGSNNQSQYAYGVSQRRGSYVGQNSGSGNWSNTARRQSGGMRRNSGSQRRNSYQRNGSYGQQQQYAYGQQQNQRNGSYGQRRGSAMNQQRRQSGTMRAGGYQKTQWGGY